MVHYGSLWFIVVHCGTFMVVHYGSLWFIIAHYGSLWLFIMVHYESKLLIRRAGG